MEKTEGVTYLSDSIFIGKNLPAPNSYRPNDEQTRSKSPCWRIVVPSGEKKSDKIIKSKEPDVGTYAAGPSKDTTLVKSKSVYIGRPKGQKNSERISFTK